MEITRRGLFKLTATAGLGVGIAQGARFVPGGINTVDEALGQPIVRDQADELLPSACPLCPAGCGLRLRRVGDSVCGIRPDTTDSVSGGALCPKAYGLLQDLVHSARLTSPVVRDSRTSAWRETTWAAALDQLAAVVKRSNRGMALVVPHSDPTLSGALVEYLARTLGARVYRLAWGPGQGPVDALRLACGASDAAYDLASARSIASFGADWLQESPNPSLAQCAYGKLRTDNLSTRGRLAMVSTRFGTTAMKSDAWHACRPGTEGAVALGVAGLLLQDKSRRPANVKGLEKVEAVIARDFTPQRVAQISGVSAKAVAAMARDLEVSPSVAIGTRGRLCDQWAVVVLNSVLGAIGREGGLFPIDTDLPAKALGVADGEAASADRLCDDLVSGSTTPDTVVFYQCNPAFTSAAPGRWKSALSRVSHVVSISPYRDETGALSDLILPPAMVAEREEMTVVGTARGVVARRSSAAIPPAGSAMPPMEIALEVARRVKPSSFPWASVAEVLDQAAAKASKLSQPPRGPIDLSHALDNGGDLWTPPSFTPGALHLQVVFTPAFSGGYGGHLPYLHSATAPLLRTCWTTWLEIHPATAERLGIGDGERVRVSSEVGRVEAVARHFSGVAEDMVAMPFGLGKGEGSDLTRGDGANPALLVSPRQESPDGAPLWGHQRVLVSKM